VVGWTEPEGRRPDLGALLLGYYDPNGKLIYAAAPSRLDDRRLLHRGRRGGFNASRS
jgi:hypothetical protein